MLRPTVILVTALENYILYLKFDNGEEKFFDVKPYIYGEWYYELADPVYFQNVTVNGYSIEWKNGQDICPDELYSNSVACLKDFSDIH